MLKNLPCVFFLSVYAIRGSITKNYSDKNGIDGYTRKVARNDGGSVARDERNNASERVATHSRNINDIR